MCPILKRQSKRYTITWYFCFQHHILQLKRSLRLSGVCQKKHGWFRCRQRCRLVAEWCFGVACPMPKRFRLAWRRRTLPLTAFIRWRCKAPNEKFASCHKLCQIKSLSFAGIRSLLRTQEAQLKIRLADFKLSPRISLAVYKYWKVQKSKNLVEKFS